MFIAITAEHLITSDLVIRMSTAESHSDNPRNKQQSFPLQQAPLHLAISLKSPQKIPGCALLSLTCYSAAYIHLRGLKTFEYGNVSSDASSVY
jgi:hypothetical protein